MSEGKLIELEINGQKCSVEETLTLMEAIRQSGSQTPIICFHEATTSEGLCRLCVVEVEGCLRPRLADSFHQGQSLFN